MSEGKCHICNDDPWTSVFCSNIKHITVPEGYRVEKGNLIKIDEADKP